MPVFNDLIGIPWKSRGRDKNGLDCYGLAIEVTKRFGKPLNDVYYNNHDIELCDILAPTLNIKETTEINPGNILIITFKKELHIGVIINKTEFIHSTQNQGVRISRIRGAPIYKIYEVL